MSRHWIITDANGREEEVRGPGVVGEQPVLPPGKFFEYTSGCPLPTTPFGSMRGTYQMITSEWRKLRRRDRRLQRLAEPHAVH
jgi:ApaG protein